MAKEKSPKELEKSQLNGGKSLIWEETASKQKDLKSALSEKWPNHFEKINLLSWIDENKLAELKDADLVIVYRDNNRYTDMSSSLKDLVEHKYWWKVYCVSIPQGTEELGDKEMELLKNILNTCHCMTDNTVSNWTWIDCLKIDDYENKNENSWKFLKITKDLEKKFEEKWIDTVYVYISGVPESGWVIYTCFDHWSMYQRKDWSIYFDSKQIHSDNNIEDTKLRVESFKRFWKNMFPNLKVEFIENFHIDCGSPKQRWNYDFSRCESEWIILLDGFELTLEEFKEGFWKEEAERIIDYYTWNGLRDLSGLKSEWAILISDRHAGYYLGAFWGQKILYAWNTFEPNWWIESFVDENDAQYVWSAGESLAEWILLNLSGQNNN